MNRDTLNKLQAFEGRHVIDVIDVITAIVGPSCVINVMDPLFNLGPLDHEPRRLNIRTDADSRITSFTTG